MKVVEGILPVEESRLAREDCGGGWLANSKILDAIM
jgi:hypothetical protein